MKVGVGLKLDHVWDDPETRRTDGGRGKKESQRPATGSPLLSEADTPHHQPDRKGETIKAGPPSSPQNFPSAGQSEMSARRTAAFPSGIDPFDVRS